MRNTIECNLLRKALAMLLGWLIDVNTLRLIKQLVHSIFARP